MILGHRRVLVMGIKKRWDGRESTSPLLVSWPVIAQRFWITLQRGTLTSDFLYSGKNFIVGFVLAVVAGVVFGVLIGWYRRLEMIFGPSECFLCDTSRSWVPLIIIWFGIGMWSEKFSSYLSPHSFR